MPSASSRPTQSAAMSDRVYEAEDRSPATAARTSGTGASGKCVERPTSRLSNRITCTPREVSSAQNPSGQPSICTARPITSSTAGSRGSPKRSYATSIRDGPTPNAFSSLMGPP